MYKFDRYTLARWTTKREHMEFSDLKPEEIEKASNMMKAISHPMRLAILGHLGEDKQLSVTEIHNLLHIEQSTASHHLGILKGVGLVRSRKEGKHVYYAVEQDHVVECCGMLFAKFCCEEEAEEMANAAAGWLAAQGYQDPATS